MKPSGIVTLLTDFGLEDAYVGAMKGAILSVFARATVVDITHAVRPFAVLQGAFLLDSAWRSFPPGTVHVAVVDPGVGTERRAIAFKAADHYFVGPITASSRFSTIPSARRWSWPRHPRPRRPFMAATFLLRWRRSWPPARPLPGLVARTGLSRCVCPTPGRRRSARRGVRRRCTVIISATSSATCRYARWPASSRPMGCASARSRPMRTHSPTSWLPWWAAAAGSSLPCARDRPPPACTWLPAQRCSSRELAGCLLGPTGLGLLGRATLGRRRGRRDLRDRAAAADGGRRLAGRQVRRRVHGRHPGQTCQRRRRVGQ